MIAVLKSYIKKHPNILFIVRKIKHLVSKVDTVEERNVYHEWINNVEPVLWVKLSSVNYSPLISVIVPTYNTPEKYLKPLIKSMMDQTYDNWQMCISDASTVDERRLSICEMAKIDDRIKYIFNEGLNISDNTNEGIKIAEGEFVGFLDHDDILSPNALEEIAVCINQGNDIDIIYSDEDKLSDDGSFRLQPFFKPSWSPDLLLGVNYITHFLVVRRTLINRIGGFRSKYDGAQDYDLLLRLTELSKNITHIPKILYHWRLADGSTAKSVGEKSYADNAGQQALRDAVKRRNINAEVVEIKDRPTNYRLRYTLPKRRPKVSIIIPFKDKPDFLVQCVESILNKTTYKEYEIILISNNSIQQDTKDVIKKYSKNKHIKSFEWNHDFNYSKINNFGVNKSTGDYVILLNNDTEVITPEWIDELVGVAIQPGVGAVGPMLLYPRIKDGIQHAGVVLGMNTMAGHVFRHHQPGDWTDFGLPTWPRNYLALTAACLMVSRRLYDKIGGLDEIFTVAGNDVAFCLRLHESGYRNIYWPFVSLYHHESVSVGSYNNGIQLDYDHSLDYYKPYHISGDKYFNPNLDLMNEQIGIKL